MIRCASDKMQNEFLNSISLTFSLLKHSRLFSNIYSGDTSDIEITDEFNNGLELLKIIDPELILDAIYRGSLLGLRGKSIREISEKIYEEIINNEKYARINLTILCKYNKYIKLHLNIDDTKLLFYIIYGNKAISIELKNVLNGVSNWINVNFYVLPNLTNDNLDNYIMKLNYNYTNNSYNELIDITYRISDGDILAKYFDIMEDIVMDAQIYNGEYVDIIYKNCISKLNKEVTRIFSTRGDSINYKHFISPYIIKGFCKEFNDFIIQNALNLKYSNRTLNYKDCIFHNTYKSDNFYCIDIRGDIDSDSALYNIKLLEITDGKASIVSFNRFLEEYSKVFYGETANYYNIMDIIEGYITFMDIDRSKYVNVYHSPIFIESYADEIKKWNSKIYYLNNGRTLFWCDDFSKTEGVIDDEEFINQEGN